VSDAPQAQDVLLRRRAGSEEVLVSALLAPMQFADQEPLPRAALMKVFVAKPGATPVLHFDCRTSLAGEEGGAAGYAVNAVRYHSFPGDAGEDKYEGPSFR
jgi:complement component 1 Q subcomponent-binding protein, mitochondrial